VAEFGFQKLPQPNCVIFARLLRDLRDYILAKILEMYRKYSGNIGNLSATYRQ
jgi:hypothetical protein